MHPLGQECALQVLKGAHAICRIVRLLIELIVFNDILTNVKISGNLKYLFNKRRQNSAWLFKIRRCELSSAELMLVANFYVCFSISGSRIDVFFFFQFNSFRN